MEQPPFATLKLSRVGGMADAWTGEVESERVLALCTAARARDARLAALWGDSASRTVWLVLIIDRAVVWLDVTLPPNARWPDLSALFPSAARMQRTLHDLLGFAHAGADQRPWLRHGVWSAGEAPLGDTPLTASPAPYLFTAVPGDGVHEIPLGPVRGGVCEPAHFRLSVVGEQLLRIEMRPGYAHRGVHHRFRDMEATEGARLAGRVAGDSTVAYAWAYAMALEAIAGTQPSPRALHLRAVLLERERIANHYGDLGALAAEGGLTFGHSQCMRLKEEMLRLNDELFGHRYAMDAVVPGGVTRTFGRHGADSLLAQCDALERETRILHEIYEEHAGLQDRFIGTGRLTAEAAAGTVGPVARASGYAVDVRAHLAYPPYDTLGVTAQTAQEGDVAARVRVRFAEISQSLRLIRSLVERLPLGEIQVPFELPAARRRGVGRVEGWRGEVLLLLETEGTRIRHCHPVDPSWHNGPALEAAALQDAVPEFPLTEASFHLSCAGHDL